MIRVLSLSVVAIAFTSACSIGPTTKQEVCDAYQELGVEFAAASGVYANGVFREAGDLSSVADRYEGGTSLKSDADALEKISDSKETDGMELSNATRKISALCGKSLISAAVTGWK